MLLDETMAHVNSLGGLAAPTRDCYRSLEYPAASPAYRTVAIDPTEHIWVEESPLPGDSLGIWRVDAPNGTLQAVVRMPRRFQLMEAGGDDAAGVRRDELDVETARVYRLIKTDH